MSTPEIVEEFMAMYQSLNKDNLHLLKSVYAEDVEFVDAMHEVKGLPALTEYFAGMYGNLTSVSIQITGVQTNAFDAPDEHGNLGQAYMTWVMTYSHPRLAGGKPIDLDGVTRLLYSDKVNYHRDYADLGQMLYEHIPLLGSVIRLVKSRAVS